MPEKKPKPAHRMTDDEIARRLFPKKLHEHLKRVANPPEPEPREKRSSPSKDST
jgi:hypothetical protein